MSSLLRMVSFRTVYFAYILHFTKIIYQTEQVRDFTTWTLLQFQTRETRKWKNKQQTNGGLVLGASAPTPLTVTRSLRSEEFLCAVFSRARARARTFCHVIRYFIIILLPLFLSFAIVTIVVVALRCLTLERYCWLRDIFPRTLAQFFDSTVLT